MHKLIDVSVVIVNWNTCELLENCLKALIAYTSSKTTYEIIVVDNGSTDGSPEMIEQHFPAVALIRNQNNLGFAKANNQAIAVSTGRYILLLNSDTELNSDALTAMVHFMDAHPSAGICGAKLLNADGTRQYSCDLFPRTPYVMLRDKIRDTVQRHPENSWQNRMAAWDFDRNFAVDYLIGAVLLIRRETLEQIGLLDEHFFMYAEDIDWCYRAHLKGWQTYYLGTVSIYHYNRGSSDKSAKLSTRLQALRRKSLLQFYRKHYGFLSCLACRIIFALKVS
ncbi:glycosyl transferase family 2 [Candidatus Vecturithrix granuli]|uniref:Glycosyl transferase family 2 n=1 Tax=Vecturithrix granuli TaxID=1499967 RepID=A0A081BTS4_VECG1|nr:glycosyl transferase family 2 [Candidatus Vecturithrix granuli]